MDAQPVEKLSIAWFEAVSADMVIQGVEFQDQKLFLDRCTDGQTDLLVQIVFISKACTFSRRIMSGVRG